MFAQLTGKHSRRMATLGPTSYGPAS